MREDILARGEDPADFPILNSKPELFGDLLWIWEGFMVLSTCRQYGMSSPQPISMGEIHAYCQFNGIYSPDEREEFLHHITKLDLVFLADWRVKNPSGKKPPAGASQRGNFQA